MRCNGVGGVRVTGACCKSRRTWPALGAGAIWDKAKGLALHKANARADKGSVRRGDLKVGGRRVVISGGKYLLFIQELLAHVSIDI